MTNTSKEDTALLVQPHTGEHHGIAGTIDDARCEAQPTKELSIGNAMVGKGMPEGEVFTPDQRKQLSAWSNFVTRGVGPDRSHDEEDNDPQVELDVRGHQGQRAPSRIDASFEAFKERLLKTYTEVEQEFPIYKTRNEVFCKKVIDALDASDEEICRHMKAEAEADEDRGVGDLPEAPEEHDVGDFARAFQRHKPYLLQVALRMSGKIEIAEDLVQDTFMRGFKKLHQFQPGTNMRAWLSKILSRLYLDHLRRERVVNKAQTELLTLEPTEHAVAFDTVPDTQLFAAIQSLEPGLRTVVQRCYLEDRSYRETAEELNVPVGTIGTRLMRARQHIKAHLAGTIRAHMIGEVRPMTHLATKNHDA
jgi:RNA polymerase sigma-70 factor (ECF subfamily)